VYRTKISGYENGIACYGGALRLYARDVHISNSRSEGVVLDAGKVVRVGEKWYKYERGITGARFFSGQFRVNNSQF